MTSTFSSSSPGSAEREVPPPRGERDAPLSRVEQAQLLRAARMAALRAGSVIGAAFLTPPGDDIEHKGAIDLVTATDRAAEEVLRAELASTGIAVLGEEEGLEEGAQDAELLWVVDPIDGTTNFAHRVPHCAVSVGLSYQGRPVLGVIANPITHETFEAGPDGATLNGRALRPLAPKALGDCLLVTGFPYDRRTNSDNNLAAFQALVTEARGVRRLGAASLDLAFVAAGRLDGYWELRVKPWDVMAGWAMVEAVGGRFTTMYGTPWTFEHPDRFPDSVLAAHPGIGDQMLPFLRAARPQPPRS